MFSRAKSLHIIKRFSHTHKKTEFPNCSICPNSVNCNENNNPKIEIDKKIENINFDIDDIKEKLIYHDNKLLFMTTFNILTLFVYYS
jgi:hypothetical protein